MILSCKLCAQQNIWSGSRERLEQNRNAAGKKTSKIKEWKDYVSKWGIDSNYNHAFSLSARLNTDGWSAGASYLRQLAPGRRRVLQLHFSEIKHEKETKQQQPKTFFPELGSNTPYIFGKINNAYTLQIGMGREQTLFPALLDGNLSLSLRYTLGPSLAMLKPYYLKLVHTQYIPEERRWISEERYSSSNDGLFLEEGSILGSAGWSRGLSEIRYIPGGYAEAAVMLEPDKPKSFVKTIIIGGNIAIYSSPIKIMAARKAYPYQACFFVGLALGKRW